MVHEDESEAKMKNLTTRQEVTEDIALLVMPTRCDPSYNTAAQPLVLK